MANQQFINPNQMASVKKGTTDEVHLNLANHTDDSNEIIRNEFTSLFNSIKSGVQTGVKTAVKAGKKSRVE